HRPGVGGGLGARGGGPGSAMSPATGRHEGPRVSEVEAAAATAAAAAAASASAFAAASTSAAAAAPAVGAGVPVAARRAAAAGDHLVAGWLFSTARETSPSPQAAAPVGCAYGEGVGGCTPSGLPRALVGSGGPLLLFPLVRRAQSEEGLCAALRLVGAVVKGGGAASCGFMQTGGGYLILAGLLREKRRLLGAATARACFTMAADWPTMGSHGGRGPGSYGVEGGGSLGEEWDWEKQLSFMSKEEVEELLREVSCGGSGVRAGVRGGGGRRGGHGGRDNPFMLLTDPYALKH
ncbi:unnamed protein product, partial [Discosporangium mesarthrocarpum]